MNRAVPPARTRRKEARVCTASRAMRVRVTTMGRSMNDLEDTATFFPHAAHVTGKTGVRRNLPRLVIAGFPQ
jgi:hypothetical protein